jgi:hypothetical protein
MGTLVRTAPDTGANGDPHSAAPTKSMLNEFFITAFQRNMVSIIPARDRRETVAADDPEL